MRAAFSDFPSEGHADNARTASTDTLKSPRTESTTFARMRCDGSVHRALPAAPPIAVTMPDPPQSGGHDSVAPTEAPDATDPSQRLRAKVVDSSRDLTNRRRPSRVIGVTFTSESSRKAPHRNTLADLYIIGQLTPKFGGREDSEPMAHDASPNCASSRSIESAAEQYRADAA